MVDQDAAHETRRKREEVRAILPLNAPQIDQADERFVDQSRRLESVIAPLASELEPGETAKLLMDDWHQLVERNTIAAAPREQQFSHVRP
jgi:hypothetical protein